MKFIFIDRSNLFRKYLREFITKKDDEYKELSDGENLNSIYNEFQPDWVLLDIPLKTLNGIKTAELLKKEFPAARFAFVTEFTDKRCRMEAEKTNPRAFISKENLFELQELIYPKKQLSEK